MLVIPPSRLPETGYRVQKAEGSADAHRQPQEHRYRGYPDLLPRSRPTRRPRRTAAPWLSFILVLREYWRDPSDGRRDELAQAVSFEGLREEVLGEVPPEVAERISPDLWQIAWPLMRNHRDIMVGFFSEIADSVRRFPQYQAYLRRHQPPTLIVWGSQDGYMPAESARAYLADVPDVELHLFEDGGHWLLETHLDEVVARIRPFLSRVREASGPW
jgi:pimeloyl-ACP methyl ester carboxylesterase